MTTRRPGVGERVFRQLLRALPSDFRSDFGDDMRADLDRPGVDWWTSEIPGLLKAIVREHADMLRQDVKYGWRSMRRTPGFTILAIVMLALGTGANVAMFSVIDAVMLRSPFVDPDGLAFVRAVDDHGSAAALRQDQLTAVSSAPVVAALALVGGGSHVLTGAGDPRNLDNIECVTPSMFEILATPPLFGRALAPDDDRPGAVPAMVLSYTFWKSLGGSTDILGSALVINATPVMVVGVMPRGYYGAQARPGTQGWLPYHRPVADAENTGCRQSDVVTVVARLRPGVTREAATASTPGLRFEVLESVWMDSARTPLEVLGAAVACVLLIACFNVGGLQMERTLARRRELSVRLALGASHGRLARQILTESLVFALAGAAAGVGATALSLRALVSILPPNLPYLAEIGLNERALAVAIAAGAAAGLLSGIFPLFAMRHFSSAPGAVSARATEARTGWMRQGLAVGQIALSLVVLVGAGLMIRTFLTLRPATPGFDPDHKLWQPARLRGATPEANAAFYAGVLERLHPAPGVRDVAGTTYVPMIGLSGDSVIDFDGTPGRALTNCITPNFFDLMRIPIAAGRAFTAVDIAGADPVVIVNQTLARRIDPYGVVIGRRILMSLAGIGMPGPPSFRTIVGVITDTRGSGIDVRPRSEAYLPFAQNPRPALILIVDYQPGRSAEAAASVRRAILEVKPGFVLTPPSELREMIDKQVATPRFGAWLLGLFAGLALLLAAIGLTTTIGWWVTQRSREIGVRMALGASRVGILRLVIWQGGALAAGGVLAGAAAAAALTRYMEGWIYGVTPLDPATFAVGAAVMFVVALGAVYLPARRATAVDPIAVLRAE